MQFRNLFHILELIYWNYFHNKAVSVFLYKEAVQVCVSESGGGSIH